MASRLSFLAAAQHTSLLRLSSRSLTRVSDPGFGRPFSFNRNLVLSNYWQPIVGRLFSSASAPAPQQLLVDEPQQLPRLQQLQQPPQLPSMSAATPRRSGRKPKQPQQVAVDEAPVKAKSKPKLEKAVDKPAKAVANKPKRPEPFVPDGKKRCWEPTKAEQAVFHDSVWGQVLSDSTELFEILSLDVMQSGLSWFIVWKKREGFREAFSDWNFHEIAKFGPKEREGLLQNPNVIRNRRKIDAIINNALVVSELETELPGSFAQLLWRMAPPDDQERLRHGDRMDKNYMRDDFKTKPQDRLVSDGVHPTISCGRMEDRLKAIGFRHIGGTCILSFMQHVGMMNHHNRECYLFSDLEKSQLDYRKSLEAFWATKEGKQRAAALDALLEKMAERVKNETRAAAKAKREASKAAKPPAKKKQKAAVAGRKRKAESSSSSEEEQNDDDNEAEDNEEQEEESSGSESSAQEDEPPAPVASKRGRRSARK